MHPLSRYPSLRAELAAILCLLLVLLGLPIISLLAVTNVGALINPGVSIYDGTRYFGDNYDYGECTYWAALRRSQTGYSIPNTWGDAATWASRAMLDNYTVNHVPSVGSIMQTPYAANGLGHVAFVEKVNTREDSWTISEMNHTGWDEVDERTFPYSSAIFYNFIH